MQFWSSFQAHSNPAHNQVSAVIPFSLPSSGPSTWRGFLPSVTFSHVYRDEHEQQNMHLPDTLMLLIPQPTEKCKQGLISDREALLLSTNSSFSKH